MRRPRRNHSAKFKTQIALEAIRGEKTIAEIAAHHEVRPNQVTARKAQVLENLETLFGAQGLAGDSKERIRELHEKIGQLTMERDFCPMRSGDSPARTARDDRWGPGSDGEMSGTASGRLARERVLPTAPGFRAGPEVDAAA